VTGIFPGSFDPCTVGHADLIKRGARLFDSLVVAVLNNPAKTPLFTIDERVSVLQEQVSNIQTSGVKASIKIEAYDGLLVDFAKKHNANYILRGVRSESDCAYEIPMAQANRALSTGLEYEREVELETIILVSDSAHSYVSSGLVREIAATSGFNNKMLDRWVSPTVKKMLEQKLRFS